ncbi:MAG: Fe(2+)-trafficking protein [Myxococcota bacterium]
MEKEIDCPVLGKRAPAMLVAPFPGKLGKELLGRVSQPAFAQWQELQVKLINEYRLDLSQAKDRRQLLKHLREFFHLDEAPARPDR